MAKWWDHLSDEDRMFVMRFVLASGSLKEMAKLYGVSYPTVRLRLDRLIAKINMLDSGGITNEFERVLRALFAEGKIEMQALKTLLSAHKQELEQNHETHDLDKP